jgi:hypothetical protein
MSISTRHTVVVKVLKGVAAAVVSVAFLAGSTDAAEAGRAHKKYRKAREYSRNYSPSEIAERQRHASTFDETEYYEHLSEKIPFGTAAWWRQKQLETMGRR